MVEVIYYAAVSLDGYVATPDGSVEWLSPFMAGGEDHGFAQFFASIDALLLGRRTFEQALGFGEWPYTGKPCLIFSRGPLTSAGPEVEVTAKGPREVIDDLGSRGLRRVWLVGGPRLAASFRESRLISEYVVSVIPVILGGGLPLFAPTGPVERLDLAGTEAFSSGVVQLRYSRRPTPTPGRDVF